MVLHIRSTNVIWHYKGYDDGILVHVTPEWNDLPKVLCTVCEYAYQHNIEEISTKNGEYLFDLKKNLMFIYSDELLFEPIPIKRSS